MPFSMRGTSTIDGLARVHPDEVHDRPPLGRARRERDLVHLLHVDLPLVGEEEDVRVGRRDEELRHPVLLARVHPDLALAAALLRPVGRRARPLDVARVGDRDDHVLFLDEILLGDLRLGGHDLGPALVRVLLLDLLELHHDDVEEELLVRQDGAEARDGLAQLPVLLGELLLLEAREARQAHLEDRLGLPVGQVVVALRVRGVDLRLGAAGAADELLEPRERELHEGGLRDVRVRRLADGLHHEIEIGDGHPQALDDLALPLGLTQLEARPPRHDVAPVLDEARERRLQIEDGRAPADDGEVDDAERRLQIRHPVELVHDDLRQNVLLELDDEPDPVAVRLVPHLGDALDALLAHQLAELGVHAGLVHLVGDLGDDDLLTLPLARDLLDVEPRSHHDRPAPGALRLVDARAPVDEAGRREVGAGDEAHEIVDGRVRIADEMDRGLEHLAQVVRRHVGRHADGDAARPVDEEVRHARREDGGLLEPVVEVRREVDALLLDVGEQLAGDPREAGLGVAVRGRGVAVDRAEVALPVDERVAHREVLREADHGVVHGRVAVRVVLAEHVSDDRGALPVGDPRCEAGLVHGEEDAPVDGLEAVPHVGDGAPDDDAHRVVEVARPHLVLDRDGDSSLRVCRGRGFGHGSLS
jgi:hypothetical protein